MNYIKHTIITFFDITFFDITFFDITFFDITFLKSNYFMFYILYI